MTSTVRCAQCGAPFRAGDERFCSFCGAQRPARTASPTPSIAERFAAARADPRLRELKLRTPSTAGRAASNLFLLGILVFFCLFAATILGKFRETSQAFGSDAALFGLIPWLVLGAGVFALARHVLRAGRFHSAELQRHLARVVDERIEVNGGKHVDTTYYTTLEWENRTRTELENRGRLAGQITRDEIGLAYVKDDVLLDFVRLDA